MTWRSLLSVGRLATDDVLVAVLGTLAMLGLSPSYTGWEYLCVGVLGVLLGLACARVARWRRWPAGAAMVIAVALVLVATGPLCLRASGDLLPTPTSLADLLDTVIRGWKELVTTLPPVDGTGHLLVLPWLLGLGAGVGGGLLLTLAERCPEPTRIGLPLLAPSLLLAAVVLLGVRRPASLLLQGIGFAVVAVVWLVVRAAGRTSVQSGGRVGTLRRAGLGAALIAVAAGAAVPMSGALADDGHRRVLRAEVVPPIDIEQYGSPLASFRRFVRDPHPGPLNVNGKVLMRVTGAPAGTRIRFATMDRYDGNVWRASEESARALPGVRANAFLRVGQVIDNPVRGRTIDVGITLGDGWTGTSAVWLPTIGALRGIRFEGGDGQDLAGQVRYDLATSTALVPGGLRPGDRYDLVGVLTDDSLTADTRAATGVAPELESAAGFVDDKAQLWGRGPADPMAQVLRAAEFLKQHGYYSDGVADDERIYHPGHYEKRLGPEFVDADLIVGDDEQYAAAMALIANRLGVPARVVLGAEVPADGVVHGSDVHAWVEVQAADGSWRTLPTSAFMSRRKPADLPPQQTQKSKGSEAPPPAPAPPPSALDRPDDRQPAARKDASSRNHGGVHVPRWVRITVVAVAGPLLLLLLLVGVVVGAKTWRRFARRRAPQPSTRVVGAWRELVDHARDLGHQVPVGGTTRREQAVLVAAGTALLEAPALARTADGHVFGPTPPGDLEAAAYWTRVEAARRALSSGTSRRRRLRAALSTVTLRRRWPSDRESGHSAFNRGHRRKV